MANRESWASNLHNRKVEGEAFKCKWSDEYQITIHKFKLGERRCQCRETFVEEKEAGRGWGRTSNENSDKPTANKGSKTGHD